MQPTVLYEDNHLLVINKPAGLPTVGVVDRQSAYLWAQGYIKRRYNKPGNVFIGVVSRLDTVTSGVLVLARTSKGASRLSEQIRMGTIKKTYLAIVEGSPKPRRGQLVDWLNRDEAAHRMRVLREHGGEGAQRASLTYEVLESWDSPSGNEVSAVQINLETGRKHQIRVQFSSRRLPVWGDHKYGSRRDPLDHGIALHSWKLEFEHPTQKTLLKFVAPPPSVWNCLMPPGQDLLVTLGS